MSSDTAYLELVLEPIKACAHYKPKFGQGARGVGLTLEQFRELYRKDSFYSWFGLDNPMMYAAHKAAGGMTSVYRQIGTGCERLFRAVLKDSLGLADADVVWSYEVSLPTGKTQTLHLDGRIPLDKIPDQAKRERLRVWMEESSKAIGVERSVISNLTGVIFEVRQGYKSKDAKRQNADIANAATAYAKAYLPCAVVLSGPIDNDILSRYRMARWIVLTGAKDDKDASTSTYAFMRDVIGYDLAAFFERNSKTLRAEIESVLKALLAPEAT
ncbi:MAG: hypothetical protein ACK4JD_07190 [Thermoflexales bacterium]